MTTQTQELPTVPLQTRTVRGLRFPVLPSGSLLAQVAGGVGLLGGLYLQFGIAVTLIVAGAGTAVLGALKESGKI